MFVCFFCRNDTRRVTTLVIRMRKIMNFYLLEAVKHIYFKIDDILYQIHIMQRYLPDTPRYVSGEYPTIKFYFLKKNNCLILRIYMRDIVVEKRYAQGT